MGMRSEDLHGRRCYEEKLSWLRIIILKSNSDFPLKISIIFIFMTVNIFSQLLKVGNKIDVISGYIE